MSIAITAMGLVSKGSVIAATLLVVVSGAIFVGFRMQEITAQEYRLLRLAMKDGDTVARQEIATRMMDGKVNKWEYSEIVHVLWNGSAPALTASATSVAEERLVLLAMARQMALPR